MAPDRLPSPVIHGVGSRPTGDRTRHHFQLNIKVTVPCSDVRISKDLDARPPLSGALPLTLRRCHVAATSTCLAPAHPNIDHCITGISIPLRSLREL